MCAADNMIPLNRLHQAFKRTFDAEIFTYNILNKTEILLKVPECEIPSTSGIPITDVFLYGFQRIKTMGIEHAHLYKILHERLSDLVNKTDSAFQPVMISAKGTPTLLEVYFADQAKNMPDGSDRDLEDLKKVIARSPQSKRLVNTPELSLIALRLAGGKITKIGFIEESLKYSSVRHLLENESDTLSDRILINLIDSAVDLKLDLSTLKLRGKHLLKDAINIFAEPDVVDKFEAARVKQKALEFVEQNSEHIDHTFNPDLYFDF